MIRTLFEDILVALSLLTRIPLKVPAHAYNRMDKAVWAYVFAGIIWGFSTWTITFAFAYFGLPVSIASALGLSAGIIATGAMHEDGLADSADGILGSWNRSRRLEIMKDSFLGAYGVLAIVLSTIIRWQLIFALFANSYALVILIIAGCLSRSVLPIIMAMLNHAREEGLSHSVGRPSGPSVYISLSMTILFAFFTLKIEGLMLCFIAVLLAFACAKVAQRTIHGQTGDILGATAIFTETGVLIASIILLK